MTTSLTPLSSLLIGIRRRWRAFAALVPSLLVTCAAHGQVQIFEGSLENWQADVGSDTAFTTVDIYFTRLQTGVDGSAIDDLRFELAPPRPFRASRSSVHSRLRSCSSAVESCS